MKTFLIGAFLFVLYLFIICEFSFAKGNVAVLGVGGAIAGTAESSTKDVGYKATFLDIWFRLPKRVNELSKRKNN
ncbi:MAG: hypothetical protein LBB06_02755 [Endomicrobium sp.]|jgi:L-asparaginase/Glu-tRNA(Gln) amidotransferase subunit D|nr:hypothetical protein [Endomicrobium sp.]